ncbi:MAG: GNAT family N-acetyltransferase [Candidatus Diapherotrites archaeon]|nr:GNAT family N-acetyltransferase [Candidatus Diapherotrites archaeon]
MAELQNLSLREAELRDAEQIQRNIFPNKTIEQIENRINSAHKRRIVAEYNNEIIGYAVLAFRTVPHAHTALLHSLFVKENFRNVGIGRAIVEYAERLALQNGIEILLLEAGAENKNAIPLYKKLGFEEYGLLKNGYKKDGNYKDLALMKKSLGK